MAYSSKTIIKNTAFLYFRMFVTMIISLYTSRVILQTLGIDDYGIYQAVGGIVGLLSFLNSGSTSRFLTYELGKGNKETLENTFSTVMTVHIIIATLVVLLGETVGLWYFNNKMVIPDDRLGAATIVFHLSIITAFIAIVCDPYNSAIIAHEKMKVFAYIGIIDVIVKLGIAYALVLGSLDKLVLFATLLFLAQLGVFVFYYVYCTYQFEEAKYKFLFIDKQLFVDIFSFSGWSLFSTGAIALNGQGVLLLLNLFFAPAVVTARSISLTVYNMANQFVKNFRTASNPQIVKQLAAGDIEGSHRLLLQSTAFSYYLMFIICLPICLLASPMLDIWLVEVPEYTVVFLRLVIIQSLFQVFDTSFYTALFAKGKIRENALISPIILFIQFPLVYFLFKQGFSPVALSWASLFSYAILGCVIKPFLIVKVAEYKWSEVLKVMLTCLMVTLASIPVPILCFRLLDVDNHFFHAVIVLFVSLISVATSVWFIGLTDQMKLTIVDTVKNKFIIH